MRKRREDQDDIMVEMTPMIDIVFLLLIFFLVATTLKKLDRELPVQLPDATMAVEAKVDADTLIIGLDAQGQLYLETEPVTTEAFHSALRAAAEANPDTRVRIHADRGTPYQAVVHVMDQCLFWDLRNIGFHLRREAPARLGD